MNDKLIAVGNKLKKNLFSLNYLPRWIVLFIDIFLTIVAMTISYLIVRMLRVHFYDTLDVPTRYGIVLFVNIIFFLIFKTYSGILRLSTFIDGIKLLYASLSTFVVLVIINYSTYFAIGKKYTYCRLCLLISLLHFQDYFYFEF